MLQSEHITAFHIGFCYIKFDGEMIFGSNIYELRKDV